MRRPTPPSLGPAPGIGPRLSAQERAPGAAGTSQPDRAARGFSLRAALVAFALIPLNSLWIVHTEIVRYAGHPTTTSLFFNVVFSLTVLIAVNAILRRLRPA